jgi:hypothetical protein
MPWFIPRRQQPNPADEAKTEDAARRGRIRAYFDHKYDKDFAQRRHLRMSTRRRKLVLGIVAGGLLVASVLALAASKWGYRGFRGLEPYEIAVAAIAVVLLIYMLRLRTVEELPQRQVVEQELDTVRDGDIAALLATAADLAPSEGGSGAKAKFDHILIGYPDKKASEDLGFVTAARIGLDGTPRLTPAMVTAVRLGRQSLTIYEGTVDLTTGALVSERLLDLAYRDITTMERGSVAVQSPPAPVEGGGARAMLNRLRPRQQLRDKDSLTLHFASGLTTRIMLRDCTFSEQLRAANLPLASPQDRVEAFWQALRAKWLETVAGQR